MKQPSIKHTNASKATLSRLPLYYHYLTDPASNLGEYTSATKISQAMGLGEIQVRKDLGLVSGIGRPKVGYKTEQLIKTLEKYLGYDVSTPVALVGVGRLGEALLEYSDFSHYGLEIVAAFDNDEKKIGTEIAGMMVRPVSELSEYCKNEQVHMGIIATPVSSAQGVCDALCDGKVKAIWNLAPVTLKVSEEVRLMRDNSALTLAFLNMQTKFPQWVEEK